MNGLQVKHTNLPPQPGRLLYFIQLSTFHEIQEVKINFYKKLNYIGQFSNWMKHGKGTEYYPDNKVKYEENEKNTLLIGAFV